MSAEPSRSEFNYASAVLDEFRLRLRNYIATQIGGARCKITVNEGREGFDPRLYTAKVEALVDVLEFIEWENFNGE